MRSAGRKTSGAEREQGEGVEGRAWTEMSILVSVV
jgi:hypothetical protein